MNAVTVLYTYYQMDGKKIKKNSSELNQVCDPFLFRRFFSSLFEIGELLTGDFRVALMFFFVRIISFTMETNCVRVSQVN